MALEELLERELGGEIGGGEGAAGGGGGKGMKIVEQENKLENLFLTAKSEAKKLAKSILNTAKRFDKKGVAILTNMHQPLGNTVGNSLELIECIDVLKGKGDETSLTGK